MLNSWTRPVGDVQSAVEHGVGQPDGVVEWRVPLASEMEGEEGQQEEGEGQAN